MPAAYRKRGLRLVALILLMGAACGLATESPKQPTATDPDTVGAVGQTPTPTDAWLALLDRLPFPYTTPLPPRSPTALDGFYAKFEPQEGTPVPCRRCPDYLPAGGLWRLNLDGGAYRILHAPTGWRSLGSFSVAGERLFLFNDPACYRTTGIYTWRIEGGALHLQVLEDGCQLDRRARSFASRPWPACQPPSTEAGATDLWPKPAGCD